MIFDLSENPLLCSPESSDIFDCLILQITNFSLYEDYLTVNYTYDE